MTMRKFVMSGVAALVLGATASAHHSTAEFDFSKKLTFDGVVETVQWTNPHCYATIVDRAGAKTKWRLEFGTPGVLVRMGWQRNSLKQGDAVNVTFSPMHDGSRGGALLTASFADGRTLRAPIYYITNKDGAAPADAAEASPNANGAENKP